MRSHIFKATLFENIIKQFHRYLICDLNMILNWVQQYRHDADQLNGSILIKVAATLIYKLIGKGITFILNFLIIELNLFQVR